MGQLGLPIAAPHSASICVSSSFSECHLNNLNMHCRCPHRGRRQSSGCQSGDAGSGPPLRRDADFGPFRGGRRAGGEVEPACSPGPMYTAAESGPSHSRACTPSRSSLPAPRPRNARAGSGQGRAGPARLLPAPCMHSDRGQGCGKGDAREARVGKNSCAEARIGQKV